MAANISDDDFLEELLLRYEATQENGTQITVADLCKDHPHLEPVLRREIELLEKLKKEVERTEAHTPRAASASPGRFDAVGRYKPERTIGQGALGEVLLATDTELQRQVALKRLLFSSHAGDGRLRFLVEAQVTGRLDHPGVVPVHGLVYDDDKNPHYAMRLIRGESLDAAIGRFHREHPPGSAKSSMTTDLQALLRSFLAVCQTVAYAHSQGFLHRDLKPENVMVGKYGETLVVDWGLAKRFAGDGEGIDLEATSAAQPEQEEALDRQLAELEKTILGHRKGSPAYMSPEAAAGRWNEVGPASDVYSLGATLYKLLCGQLPFKDPKRVFQQIAAGEYPRPREQRSDVPFGLEAICLKAMAVKPEDRYPTALELASDIERWLADEPVLAAPEPWHMRLQRWLKRYQAWILGGTAAALIALFGAIGVAQQRQWAAEQVADEQQKSATKVAVERDVAQSNLREARRNLYLARINLVNNALDEAKYDRARDLLLSERPLPGEADDHRSAEWFDLWHALHNDANELIVPTVPIDGRLSADGKRLALYSANTIEVWDMTTGEMLRRLKFEPVENPGAQIAQFSPDLSWFVRFTEALPGGTLELTSLDEMKTRSIRVRENSGANALALAFSADERQLGVLWGDGKLQVWNLADSTESHAGDLESEKIQAGGGLLAFSPDGAKLAMSYLENSKAMLAIWDPKKGIEFRAMIKSNVYDLAWFGANPVVATLLDYKPFPQLGFIPIVRPTKPPPPDTLPVLPLDSYWVLPPDVHESSHLSLGAGPGNSIAAIIRGTRGTHLVAQADNGSIRFTQLPFHYRVAGFAGQLAWGIDSQSRAVVWHTNDILDSLHIQDSPRRLGSIAITRGGQRLLALAGDLPQAGKKDRKQKLFCLDRSGKQFWSSDVAWEDPLRWESLAERLQLSADESLVGVICEDKAQWFAVADGRPVRQDPAPILPKIKMNPPSESDPWKAAAIDFVNRRSARSVENVVQVSDAVGQTTREPGGFQQPDQCCAVAFCGDGHLLAAGSQEGRVKVWRTDDWKLQLSVAAHLQPIKSLTFWPGNTKLLTCDRYTPRVVIWDLDLDQERCHWDFGKNLQSLAIGADERNWGASWDYGFLSLRHIADDDEILARAKRQHQQTAGSLERRRADTLWGAQLAADREVNALRDLAISAWGAYLAAKKQNLSDKATAALDTGRDALDALEKLRPLTEIEAEWRKAFRGIGFQPVMESATTR